jgi:hypothetical protein
MQDCAGDGLALRISDAAAWLCVLGKERHPYEEQERSSQRETHTNRTIVCSWYEEFGHLD